MADIPAVRPYTGSAARAAALVNKIKIRRIVADEVAQLRNNEGLPDIPGGSVVLQPWQASAFDIELPQDWLVKLTPLPEGGDVETKFIVPGKGELTMDEVAKLSEEMPVREAAAAVFPGADIDELLSG
jgi:hypothetical protein